MRARTPLVLRMIETYQRRVSPRLSTRCGFSPSCSEYAAEAFTCHGRTRATWMTLRRLARCRGPASETLRSDPGP